MSLQFNVSVIVSWTTGEEKIERKESDLDRDIESEKEGGEREHVYMNLCWL